MFVVKNIYIFLFKINNNRLLFYALWTGPVHQSNTTHGLNVFLFVCFNFVIIKIALHTKRELDCWKHHNYVHIIWLLTQCSTYRSTGEHYINKYAVLNNFIERDKSSRLPPVFTKTLYDLLSANRSLKYTTCVVEDLLSSEMESRECFRTKWFYTCCISYTMNKRWLLLS